MKNKPQIAVLYHIFYEDTCEVNYEEMRSLATLDATFLFNICSQTPDKESIEEVLKTLFPHCFIIITSNKGKDIGAKLALLQLCIRLNIQADYFLFLHDKKSLQALKNRTWKKDLFKIIDPDIIPSVLQIFEDHPKCGIIATKEYVLKEPFSNGKLTGVNGPILSKLILKYRIEVQSYAFVGGTIFWAKAKPLKDFFIRYASLEIRKSLETGNVLDDFARTMTHSWERLLSWIVTSNGYFIKGI